MRRQMEAKDQRSISPSMVLPAVDVAILGEASAYNLHSSFYLISYSNSNPMRWEEVDRHSSEDTTRGKYHHWPRISIDWRVQYSTVVRIESTTDWIPWAQIDPVWNIRIRHRGRGNRMKIRKMKLRKNEEEEGEWTMSLELNHNLRYEYGKGWVR